MYSAIRVSLLLAAGPILLAQVPNTAYLAEMPTVERVKRELQGADPQDTALRQAGAFWQLQEVIRALAGLRDPDQLTPAEKALKQSYYEANFYAMQAIETTLPTEAEKAKWRNRSPYHFARTDPRFGVDGTDLFKRFFSPSLVAAFDRANGNESARFQAREQAQTEAFRAAQAQEKSAQAGLASQGQSEREVARCLASGRPELECVMSALGKGFKDIARAVDPNAIPDTAFGLRLNGAFSGQGGLSLGFHHSIVSVSCNEARRDDLYTIGFKNGQLLVTVQNEPKPYTLALTLDGKLSGEGTVSINGKVRTGTRHYTDGTTTPVYGMRTEVCTLGAMSMTGAPAPIEVSEVLGGAGSQQKESPAPLGLRMNGTYTGQSGFSVEFLSPSAVVGCRDVAIAEPYTVSRQTSQVTVTIRHPKPVTLALSADGTLTASGPIHLDGRIVTGVTGDASRPVAYQPRSADCNLGVLTPTKPPPGEAQQGADAARGAASQKR